MVFSLFALLNPEPTRSPAPAADEQTRAPPPAHDGPSPPEEQGVTALLPNHPLSPATSPSETAAVPTVTPSAHSVPTPTQTQEHGSHVPDGGRPSFSADHRPGGFDGPVELPPPPPLSASARKMSSPSLEQYHVASRSPEARRASIISPAQAAFTLPPIQDVAQAPQEPPRRASDASGAPAASPNTADSYSHPPPSVAPAPPPAPSPAYTSAPMGGAPSSPPPSATAHEGIPTPHTSSPTQADASCAPHGDADANAAKIAITIKSEPDQLREASVPVPSTETPGLEPPVASKKRPAPSRTKKGTATATKKAPPSKKRRVEVKRSETPSSRTSKPATLKAGSNKGTPLTLSPAPSARSYSAEANEDPSDDDDDEDGLDDGDADGDRDLYCICRKPDTGTFMIGCDGTCDDWFHGKCVGIEERDRNLIDRYICPKCTKAGIGRTTWKRMCRRSGCRQPARVGKSKSGKDGSKYCSEECGVLYFQEMMARTRHRDDTVKHRSTRRKSGMPSTERPSADDDLGARGGVLAAGEVKSLTQASKTAEEFKKLGDGVLSPPATPDGPETADGEYTEAEVQALARIHQQKEDARGRHQLLKDRMKFVSLVKHAASQTIAEKELKPKDYCGYDARLQWTEEEFAAWRDSTAGQEAFARDTLAVDPSSGGATSHDGGTAMDGVTVPHDVIEICDRKKCARHLDWGKLAVDSLRFEMRDNGDSMRAWDKEERGIRERAAIRSKAAHVDADGTVEVHGLGIAIEGGEAMDTDAPAAAAAGFLAAVEGEAASETPATATTAVDAAA